MIPMAIIISRTGFAGSRARASRGCLTAQYASHSDGLILSLTITVLKRGVEVVVTWSRWYMSVGSTEDSHTLFKETHVNTYT